MNTLDMFSLKGKVALITGAAGLLGPTMAEALLEVGAEVALSDLDTGRCHRVLETMGASQRQAFRVDVTDRKSVWRLVEDVGASFGKIDILVNCACQHIATPFEERTQEDFENILLVNLTGVFLCCQAVTPVMKRQGGGVMINMGSIYGMVSADPSIYGDSGLNSPEVYAASKGGVIQLTRYLAVHLARHNIRVNSLSPGGVFNNQPRGFLEQYARKTPMGRMAQREELKGALVFLASAASSYVTGHNLVVDGGFTIW